MLMTAADYRESLRRYAPRVFVDGDAIESVADEPRLAPGVNAIGVTYDFAHAPEHKVLMTARQATSGQTVNRMAHVDESSTDLLYKLEAVRLVCRESGCAQRYLTHDGLVAAFQATRRTDDTHGTDYHERLVAYLHRVQDEDLTLGIAMTDAKGDRSKRPGLQANPRHLRPHHRAAARRHRHPRHQGDRHRRALRPRIPGHALAHPHGGRRRLRGVLRGAGRRAGRDHRRAPRRPAGRGRRQVLGQVRPVHGGRPVRRRVRAPRAGLPRRRARGGRLSDHDLRHPPPPHLHRRPRRLRRPADRRRRADGRGQRARPGRPRPHPRRHGRADHDHRELLRLRRGGVGLLPEGRQRRGDARHGLRQHRQAAAWRPRSTTCTGSPTTSRAG